MHVRGVSLHGPDELRGQGLDNNFHTFHKSSQVTMQGLSMSLPESLASSLPYEGTRESQCLLTSPELDL